MTLRLRSLHSGAYTRFSLSGPVPTALPGRLLRQLVTQLALWTGWPVDVVLSVEDPADFNEVWIAELLAVPDRHLRVRFTGGRKSHDHY